MLLLEAVRRCADEFDVLHFHLDYLSFTLFSRQQTPFVTTLHGRFGKREIRTGGKFGFSKNRRIT